MLQTTNKKPIHVGGISQFCRTVQTTSCTLFHVCIILINWIQPVLFSSSRSKSDSAFECEFSLLSHGDDVVGVLETATAADEDFQDKIFTQMDFQATSCSRIPFQKEERRNTTHSSHLFVSFFFDI